MSQTPNRIVVATPGSRAARAVATTPARRAASAEPTSTRRSVHTPLDRDLHNTTSLLSSGKAPSARKSNAPTPHARAASRARDLRRAAVFTPGTKRRQSMDRRTSLFDNLRALGRLLAPTSQPVQSSPQIDSPQDQNKLRDDEDDLDLPIDRPRLSLNLDADEEDDDLLAPTSHGLEDENYTARSIELPRRAASELPPDDARRSSLRVSDFFNPNRPLRSEEEADLGFFPAAPLEGVDDTIGAVDDGTLERIEFDDARRETLGRYSDFGLRVPLDIDQSTFVMEAQANDSVIQDVTGRSRSIDGPGPEAGDWDDVPLGDGLGEEDDFYSARDQPGTSPATKDLSGKAASALARNQPRKRKAVKLSQHGLPCPSLPPIVVRKLAQTFAQTSGMKPKMSKDTLDALSQASDWFFEQVAQDLKAYAEHAGRKTIEESDMVTLLQRQRQTSSSSTLFSVAQKHLPRELLQELRMPAPERPRKRRRTQDRRGAENDSDDLADAEEVDAV